MVHGEHVGLDLLHKRLDIPLDIAAVVRGEIVREQINEAELARALGLELLADVGEGCEFCVHRLVRDVLMRAEPQEVPLVGSVQSPVMVVRRWWGGVMG